MPGSIRFADFELDLDAYSLRRAGDSIRLEKMAMDVLILLAHRPGALVSRRDIQTALWGTGVNVSYDSAINTVLRKVRRALGDDADSPTFIETVVGKGYRFIAPVVSDANGARGGDATGATRPELPTAYKAYLCGRHAWNKRSEIDLREAIRFFQESLDADPTYAPAYAGLADSYAQLGYGSYVSPEDSFARRARQQSARSSSIQRSPRPTLHSATR